MTPVSNSTSRALELAIATRSPIRIRNDTRTAASVPISCPVWQQVIEVHAPPAPGIGTPTLWPRGGVLVSLAGG